MAKQRTMSGAMTKGGMASMPKVPAVATRSSARLGRGAANRASGMATAKAMIWEITISSMSTGKRLGDRVHHRLVIGERLAQVPLEDVPQPDEVLLEQGLVEAQWALRTTTLCLVAAVPSMDTAGVPGSRCTM